MEKDRHTQHMNIILQYIHALHGIKMLNCEIHHNTIQYSRLLFKIYTTQHHTVQCNTIQYNTIHQSKIQTSNLLFITTLLRWLFPFGIRFFKFFPPWRRFVGWEWGFVDSTFRSRIRVRIGIWEFYTNEFWR